MGLAWVAAVAAATMRRDKRIARWPSGNGSGCRAEPRADRHIAMLQVARLLVFDAPEGIGEAAVVKPV
jgi:hypothetical protein